MEKQQTKHIATAEAGISALLDLSAEAESIVDGLMKIPLSVAPGEWDAAVSRRLEQRLARTMRAMIEGEPGRKSA